MKRWLVTAVLLVACEGVPTNSEQPSPSRRADAPFPVDVRVTVDGTPRAGVSVLQAGGAIQGETSEAGRFTVRLDPTVPGEVWVVAALPGHRSVGSEIEFPTAGTVELALESVRIDNPDYPYGEPGVGGGESTAQCSHCHIRLVEQFGASAHRGAASDPKVHDLFAGTASGAATKAACTELGGRWLRGIRPGGETGERCYLGRGVLPDADPSCGAPGQPVCDGSGSPPIGRCADCHAPAIEGTPTSGRSLLEAEGLAYTEGVHCDFCHKVAAVEEKGPPGVAGRLRLGRPLEPGGMMGGPKQAMYGPYADVLNPFMGGVYSPLHATTTFCSGCHEYSQTEADGAPRPDPKRWPDGALPVLSTHTEWSSSSFAPAVPCAGCHMPAVEAGNAADLDMMGLEPGRATGFARAPGTVRNHSFVGPLHPVGEGRFIETAVTLSGTVQVAEGALEFAVDVFNSGAGHALPTGEPMRSAVVVLEARCDGDPLTLMAGDTIGRVGGALASGRVGEEIAVDGMRWVWPAGEEAARRARGLELRVLRPTGRFLDYDGVPPFEEGGRFVPSAKGRPERAVVGRAQVVVDGDGFVASAPIGVQKGDLVFLARMGTLPVDGDASLGLAGRAGRDFARVLVGDDGELHVPHHRAVDIARDDRLMPGAPRRVAATFALPDGCVEPVGEAAFVYRAVPLELGRARGWDPREVVAATIEVTP